MPKHVMHIGLLATALLLCACGHSEGGSTPTAQAAGLPSAEAVSAVPMGHMAGITDSAALARSMPNPYADNPQAIAAGKMLFVQLNCAGCHAYDGTGNMGPNLTDTYWRYGSLPVQIYKSVRDGRARGMPAWGAALPPADIWKLVAYIQSLGGTTPVNGAAPNPLLAENVAPELQAPSDASVSADAQPSTRNAAPAQAVSVRQPAIAPGSPPAALPAGASSP